LILEAFDICLIPATLYWYSLTLWWQNIHWTCLSLMLLYFIIFL